MTVKGREMGAGVGKLNLMASLSPWSESGNRRGSR